MGSIFGAPRPAGLIEKLTCGAWVPTWPMWPRTVPPVTWEPTLSCFSSIVLLSNSKVLPKAALKVSYPGTRSPSRLSSWPLTLARSTLDGRSGRAKRRLRSSSVLAGPPFSCLAASDGGGASLSPSLAAVPGFGSSFGVTSSKSLAVRVRSRATGWTSEIEPSSA